MYKVLPVQQAADAWWAFACCHGGHVVCAHGPTGQLVWTAQLPGRAELGLVITRDMQVCILPLGLDKDRVRIVRNIVGLGLSSPVSCWCDYFPFKVNKGRVRIVIMIDELGLPLAATCGCAQSLRLTFGLGFGLSSATTGRCALFPPCHLPQHAGVPVSQH